MRTYDDTFSATKIYPGKVSPNLSRLESLEFQPLAFNRPLSPTPN